MTNETQGPITVGDINLRRRDGDIRLFQDDDLLDIPLADAPAVAAALMKLAGAPDATALVDRLCEALEKSAEGWNNALELGLIPYRHCNTATILASDARAALADAQAWRDSREGK